MSSGRSYDTSTQGPLNTRLPAEFSANPDRSILDELLTPWQARFPSGRSIEVESRPGGTDRVTIRGLGGDVELEVRLTDQGPVLRFRAAEMQLESSGAVKVDCESFEVHASGGIKQHTGGDLEQIVSGDAETWVRGDQRSQARSQQIRALQGDVRLQANDDVKLAGERVKLNC